MRLRRVRSLRPIDVGDIDVGECGTALPDIATQAGLLIGSQGYDRFRRA